MTYRHLGPVLLLTLLGACGSSGVSSGGDAGADVATAVDQGVVVDTGSSVDTGSPGADVPAAVDVPAGDDVPAAVDAGGADVPAAVDAGGTDAGSTAADAGSLFEDGGTLGEPQWATLEVRTSTSCPPLAACGGPEAGTWDVGGGCFDLPVPAALMQCPGASVTGATGRARGRVTFAGSIARRAAEWEVEATLVVPAVCAMFIGGCPGVEAAARGVNPDTTCTTEPVTGTCRCLTRQRGQIRDGDRYTTTATQIVSVTGNKRWDYCVMGNSLRYRDASGSGPREPGTIELRRR